MGSEEKKYVIHKDLLCYYSDFFRGAFNGSFKEAEEKKLPLPDDHPYFFDIFNSFLYTNQLRDSEGTKDIDLEWEDLIRLWVFGDEYLAPAFQNSVMDAMWAKSLQDDELPDLSNLKYIYEHTMPGSPLRRILTDWTAYWSRLEHDLLPQNLIEWPKEALIDLILCMNGKKTENIGVFALPRGRTVCYYHLHNEGEKCVKEKPR